MSTPPAPSAPPAPADPLATAGAIATALWPDRPTSIEPLGGGITNHNFKVAVQGEPIPVVVRIGGRDTELLGVDREAEAAATRMAASVGVGPEVVAFVDGSLVTRFIQGVPIPPETMREPATIARVAAALGAIHAAPPVPGRFDAHRIVRDYRATAAARGVPIPDGADLAMEVAERIRAARGPQPEAFCHNDLLNANFLDDGHAVHIVDWEYAGMGDRFFDLANLSVNHGFGIEHDEALLAATFGEVRARDLASLRLMRFMSDFREAMWGVVQQGISQLDFDFVAYADEHFERLRSAAADPRFEGWLHAVVANG